MKHEWKKHEKNLYGAKTSPALVYVPKQNYILISGEGDPNDADFSDRVGALYALAYGIKMNYKSESCSGGLTGMIQDFTVYPLEGVWKKKENIKTNPTELDKNQLAYTIMIRQPDFITEDMVYAALERVKKKKPNPLYSEIKFETMEDGQCIEILHIGAFDDEPASFVQMDQFAKENGMKRSTACHREIYMNNANRVPKNKLKTILRYQVG